MNSEEGLSLAKMAVAVLLVVLVIGAVVGIVYAAYKWFTSGAAKLSDQVTSIDKSAYTKFDDTTVTGNDVVSALREYRESELAILIANTYCEGNTTFDATPADDDIVKPRNYCALAADEADATDAANSEPTLVTNTNSSDYTPEVIYKDGKWWVSAITYNSDTNNVHRNTNFSPTTQTNNKLCYVKQSAKWYATLVYSIETGDVAGILFRQMG